MTTVRWDLAATVATALAVIVYSTIAAAAHTGG